MYIIYSKKAVLKVVFVTKFTKSISKMFAILKYIKILTYIQKRRLDIPL